MKCAIQEKPSRNANVSNYSKCFIYLVYKCLVEVLNIYKGFILNYSVNNCNCSLNIDILVLSQNYEPTFVNDTVSSYFLSKDTFKSLNDCKCLTEKKDAVAKVYSFLYSDENYLRFGFFEEKIAEKQGDITIYLREEEYLDFLYFIDITESMDKIMKIELNMFFNILRYLNILNVERDKNYCEFIKNMVFNVKDFNEKYIKKSGFGKLLDYRRYNAFHIFNVAECFLKFSMFDKFCTHQTFHEYDQIVFSRPREIPNYLKQYKNNITMQILDLNFSTYESLVKPNFNPIWKSLCMLLYFDKLYIGDISGISDCYKSIGFDAFVQSLPKNIKKFNISVTCNIKLIDKLNEYGFFKTIENVKIIKNNSLELLLKNIDYFNRTVKLKFELYIVKIPEIKLLEEIKLPKSIKSFKIIFYRVSSPKYKPLDRYLLGNVNNIFIDSSNQIKISRENLDYMKDLNDGYYKYLTGSDFNFYIRKINLADLKNIFRIESINRLKLNLVNIDNNFLEDYKFLTSFQSLKSLYFLNIKLTNGLLENILNCKKLTSLYFKTFEYDREIEVKNFDVSNTSILYIKFKELKNALDRRFFYFLERCSSLQHLILNIIYVLNEKEEYCKEVERNLGFNIPSSVSTKPELKNLNVKNIHEFLTRIQISILSLLSKFFNLENLEKLNYCVHTLYQKDLDVICGFKRLVGLELRVEKGDFTTNILEKILQSNIRYSIKRLRVHIDKFFNQEFLQILSFEKIKILSLGIESISETDKRYLDLLYNKNFIRLEVYILQNKRGMSSFSFVKSFILRNYDPE